MSANCASSISTSTASRSPSKPVSALEPPNGFKEEEWATFLEGVRLFNDCRYFEAHDVWEEIWDLASGPRRDLYQGLIHAAVTMEHYLRGNPRGVQGVWAMTVARLGGLDAGREAGIRLDCLLAEIQGVIRPALDMKLGRSLMQRRVPLPFDEARAPAIVFAGP